ncbi:hypothetical protein KC640_00190 [Candidatus Dojkabacteria bacterium]|uniref:Uncharacterized protein n=1 Tax=Candidatus Dojkabacteria bacterium TaxID=2099670 RepID=A0A955I6J4_9BACT|nr:hypothetical protein [Candidatus Dojkabacteria bacterium]
MSNEVKFCYHHPVKDNRQEKSITCPEHALSEDEGLVEGGPIETQNKVVGTGS